MKPKTLPYQGYYCEGGSAFQFLYGHDKQRRKTSFYDDNSLTLEMKEDDDNPSIFLVEQTPMSERVNREGRYRNPNDWSYNILNPSPTWLRGYTGHCLSRSIFSMFSYEIENSSKITIGKHLPHFDLINMLSEAYIFCSGNGEKYLAEQTSTTIEMSSSRNGRIYDPILGRMLSPDRFVPDPLSTQGYNRYSYVFNNPLRYSDPSGDLPVLIGMAVGAVVGGYLGGAAVNNTFSIAQWERDGETVGGIIQGAMFGLFLGAGIGAGVAGNFGTVFQSVLQSSGIKSGLLSGGINAMYNYDSEQDFWTTMGYFGSGFAGGALGAGVNTLLGMGVSGLGNTGVFALSLDENESATFRQYAQKFVSGALAAYAGTSVFGEVNYMTKSDGGYIFSNPANPDWYGGAKAWRQGWLNLASDFAHSSQDAFNNRSLGERMLMFGFAGGSSLIGGVFDGRIKNMKDGFGKGLSIFGMKLLEGGSDYLFQQTIHYSYSFNKDYRPFHYHYGWKKTSIFSYKSLFYALSQ